MLPKDNKALLKSLGRYKDKISVFETSDGGLQVNAKSDNFAFNITPDNQVQWLNGKDAEEDVKVLSALVTTVKTNRSLNNFFGINNKK